MFDGLFIASIIGTCFQLFKESHETVIPAENWANKELYHKDIVDGVSVEQRMKNLENGKYRLTETYPEPHRDPVSGKIVIENCELYYKDVSKYGAYKAQQWVKQGKYNLSPKELEKENKRIKEEYDKMLGLI